MEDIINHIHKFKIAGIYHELTINRENGYWSSKIDTGNSSCGGQYESLEEYIAEQVKQHTYIYYFFKDGHTAAKAIINEQ